MEPEVAVMTLSQREALTVRDIAKRYGAVTALDGVSLTVRYGEALGLLGDNGAGKSTLVKIISGLTPPDRGAILIDGEAVRLGSVSRARALGVSTVFQDLALINSLPVYRNLFLNCEIAGPFGILKDSVMRRRAADQLDDIGISIPSLDAEVGSLSGGQRQAIAVARAIHAKATVLLLDEPLAAMGAKEGAMILDLIARLKKRGDVGLMLVLHNYSHVMEVCDEINLIQRGKIAFAKRAADTSVAELTEIVVDEYRRSRAPVSN
jgi:simple sugar transport system ATP-binding protein